MMDLRERLVRIETKMDAQAEREEARDEREAALDTRITALECEANSLRSSVNTLKYVGGSFVAVATLFGDRLMKVFS
jgi:hypothetical protein